VRHDGGGLGLSHNGSVHLERLGPPVSEVILAGPIDCVVGSSARALLSSIREADCPTHFDTQAVTFIDASGLRAIAELGFCNGHRPVIIEPPRILRFLLSATGLDQAVTVVTRKQKNSVSASDMDSISTSDEAETSAAGC